MTKWRMGLVFGCCLLMEFEAAVANCRAQTRGPQWDESSSAGPKAADDKTARFRPSADNDSSSENADAPASPKDYDDSLGPRFLKNLAADQRAIWTSPTRLRLVDADWLLPLGIAAGASLATDTEFSKHLSNSPSRLRYSRDFSNYGLAAIAGVGGGLYVLGRVTRDDHKRETGILAAEAALNSMALTYAAQYSFGRERPLADNFSGSFWQGGDSFPSQHAAAAWSIASVVAHEYPGPLTSLFAYGLATAVSAARVDAKQHFPTDVLIGSALGWFVGQEVYRHHHDPELGGGDWETYAESREEGPGRVLGSSGSAYVELDSWIYPAIDQLAAMGYIHSDFLGTRPWTRIECAHLVEEAGDKIRADDAVPDVASKLYENLEREFGGDLDEAGGEGERSVRLESVYAGVTAIDGEPLHDSYHFGQTIINNFGRPYEQGFNTYDGFSGYGTAGRFTIYVRGEYQHAPFAAGEPLAVRQFIATADENPLQPAAPFATVDQFRLLDTYVSANAAGWDFSFGKQSLWWGPGQGGPLLLSDNAEPIYLFRGSRTTAIEIPTLSRLLGPLKIDFFVGKLSGNDFPPRPAIHGEKISIKPTQNLELGFSRTAEFGGVGRALTLGAIFNSYVSLKSSVNYVPSKNPGKRAGGFDFSYRVPFVRNWLTVYSDSYSPDDPTPLDAPNRAAVSSGLYMPRIPGVAKLDFRIEAVYTNTPSRDIPPIAGGQYAYWDLYYHDLYTDKNNIIGSWIGRDGQGYQAWSTYHFSGRSDVQFGYRHAKVDHFFIPGGETVNDGSVKADWWVHHDVSFSGSVQYEKWLAPILSPGPQTNWTTSVQVAFYPHSWSW